MVLRRRGFIDVLDRVLKELVDNKEASGCSEWLEQQYTCEQMIGYFKKMRAKNYKRT
jgi:hypothetical protein